MDRKKETGKPMPKITIRLPDLLIEKLDKAVQQGSFRTRSDGIRTSLMMQLATFDPNIQEATERLMQYLGNPVLPRFGAALETLVSEITPDKIEDMWDIVSGPIADYMADLSGTPVEEVKTKIAVELEKLKEKS